MFVFRMEGQSGSASSVFTRTQSLTERASQSMLSTAVGLATAGNMSDLFHLLMQSAAHS